MKFTKENINKEIKNDIDSFNIRELIVNTPPPFEWADNKHPINQLGCYHFGICDGFKWDVDKVNNADELLLWKLYGLILAYWKISSQPSLDRINVIAHMNQIDIKDSDVGKRMLKVFEEHFDWK